MRRLLFLSVCLASCAAAAPAETITLATYNVEHFQEHFLAHDLAAKLPRPVTEPTVKQLLDSERRHNDEDNWEVAQVIADPAFSPDVLVIEEGPTQSNLEYFNKRWLAGVYSMVLVFPTNTGEREQNLCMLLKPGFKVLQKKDQYYLDKDPVPNPRGERLFARGPAFCLVQAPGGYTCWVGVTHQKSKVSFLSPEEEQKIRDDNPAATRAELAAKVKEIKDTRAVDDARWRDREARRTHEIMKELQKVGTADVILLGDMNDDLGQDEAEKQARVDAVADLVEPAADGFVLVTRPLADTGEVSFGGYWRTDHRSLIDHVVVTPSMQRRVQNVGIFKGSLTPVASDHFPVFVKIRTDGAGPATAPASAGAATRP